MTILNLNVSKFKFLQKFRDPVFINENFGNNVVYPTMDNRFYASLAGLSVRDIIMKVNNGTIR